jgi:hypothetical protein
MKNKIFLTLISILIGFSIKAQLTACAYTTCTPRIPFSNTDYFQIYEAAVYSPTNGACSYTTCSPIIPFTNSDLLQIYGALISRPTSTGSGNITGLITQGPGIVITGTGTSVSPYTVTATGGGTLSFPAGEFVYGTGAGLTSTNVVKFQDNIFSAPNVSVSSTQTVGALVNKNGASAGFVYQNTNGTQTTSTVAVPSFSQVLGAGAQVNGTSIQWLNASINGITHNQVENSIGIVSEQITNTVTGANILDRRTPNNINFQVNQTSTQNSGVYINQSASTFSIGGQSSFAGAQYYSNYAPNFTARSLVDKNYCDSIAAKSTPTVPAGLLAIGDGTNALTSNSLLAFVSNTLTSPSFSATGRSNFGSLTLSTPLNSVYVSEASYWSGKQNALTFSTSITASNVVAATFSASGTSTLNNLVVPIGKTITGRKIRQEGTGASFSAGSLLFSELGADFVASPSLTGNVTTITIAGTPYNGQLLELQLTDNGTARTLAWPSVSFYGSLLPTTTVPTKTTFVFLEWRSSVSKWLCVGSLTE